MNIIYNSDCKYLLDEGSCGESNDDVSRERRLVDVKLVRLVLATGGVGGLYI